MYGEYGYMEEGKLGKAYDYRLLGRLIHYAFPYKNIIMLALVLTMLITLLDLALPYLSKIAIDRYILGTWYRVDLSRMDRDARETLARTLGPKLKRTQDGASGFMAQEQLKKLDPRFVYEQKNKRILS
jgi:ABC-type multidrug transport system fused ATPase/permease subunit